MASKFQKEEIFSLSFQKEILSKKMVEQTTNFLPGVYLIKLENGKTFEFEKIVKE